MTTDKLTIILTMAVALLLFGIAGMLFVQWRSQRSKLDQSEREVADAISHHIDLLM